MSTEKVIILIVKPDGSFELEPQGYKGKGCKKETAELESLLGVVTDVELKTEFYVETTTQQAHQFE